MKIHKNPDGANFDVLYPTLFFGSLGFNMYFAYRTCLSLNEFWALALFSIVSSYFLVSYLERKKGTGVFNFGRLFIATTGTPVLIALCLTLNYYVSFEMFHEKIALKGNIVVINDNAYISHKNAPDVCDKLFRIQGLNVMAHNDSVETKINKGILGFPILKYHKFSEASE